ncbi:MAG: DNA adenine methylase [Actinobacteria bacterium]|nr:DNA adenine methylase [Actinomycetota bacterium]
MPTEQATRIRYMGNKFDLAREVAGLIERFDPARPLVDLFGGMCSVAGAVSGSGRRVWVNDAQNYARLVARCLLQSQDYPPGRERSVPALTPAYRANLKELNARFERELAAERRLVAAGGSASAFRQAQEKWRHVGNDRQLAHEARALRDGTVESQPYRLATITFAWGYFGLRQAVEIDSMRAAIDAAGSQGDLSEDEAAWCRFALLQTCSRVASAPGHFAQFLTGATTASVERIRSARRRSVWDGTLDDLSTLAPFGTKRWRRRNRVLTCDTLTIWPTLDAEGLGKAVFYADPPYSKEQYSRFYHVLETLELYDYPEAEGTGRYRPDRLNTPLARKRGVLDATRTICGAISEREGVLLLSYPSTGLLTRELGVDISALLGEYFQKVEMPISRPSKHSTLGARHGAAVRDVTEFVWLAQ